MHENSPASTKPTSDSTFGKTDGSTLERASADAREGAKALKDRASDFADSQKKEVSESLSEFAGAIEKASEDLRGKDQTLAAQLLREAAGGLGQLSRSVGGTAPAELINSIRDFGRKNPVAFLGGAVLAGLALGRFARAEPPQTLAANERHRSTSGAHAVSQSRTGSAGPSANGSSGGSARHGSEGQPARSSGTSSPRSGTSPGGSRMSGSTTVGSMPGAKNALRPSSRENAQQGSDSTSSSGSFASESRPGSSSAPSSSGGGRDTKDSATNRYDAKGAKS